MSLNKLTFTDYFRKFLASVYFLPKGSVPVPIIIIIIIRRRRRRRRRRIEVHHMWNVKTKMIPVIIGATGTISKSFRKYVSNIPGKHEVKELQKTAILGTAHILRKVLM